MGLDISKISYGEFRNRYYNKHPRIFLTTKKTEYLIYQLEIFIFQ